MSTEKERYWVDRYEHTYQFLKIINNNEGGNAMFVLKNIRVAAATLMRILLKKFGLGFFREKVLLPAYKKD